MRPLPLRERASRPGPHSHLGEGYLGIDVAPTPHPPSMQGIEGTSPTRERVAGDKSITTASSLHHEPGED